MFFSRRRAGKHERERGHVTRFASPRSVIVGTGFMGEVHQRAVRRAGGRVVGVVGHTEEGAQRAAQAWQVELASTSLAAVLESSRPDLVHICTPNALHTEQVGFALEAGAHVICEKPLGVNSAETAAMLKAAQARGVVHAVPFAYRFYGAVRELRARVRDGAAGRVSLLHGCYLQDWLADRNATNWRAVPDVGGPSRTFADIGIHWCDLAEFVTGDRISELVATAATVHDRGVAQPTEDLVALVFRTAGGATGSLRVSQVSWGRKNRLELFVDTEQTSYGFEQERPDRLWMGTAEGSVGLERGAGFTSPDARRLDRVPAGHPQGYQDCFDALVADVYRAIAGEPPDGLPTFADGHRAAVITEAVFASVASGSWAPVG
ncbi:MAG TPA: Gfo/Idh/MocA family oxidoreductase [Jatrophihabitans sp.]|nr:Gfo/Idh/MocA family oxidoreductase [Jatrophihabitans sp.]